MRRIARTAALLLVVASLTGCAATTAPSTSPTEPSADPTPTPTADTTSRIEMGPQNTVVKDASGSVVATIRYDEDPRTAIADLTKAIGADPTLVKDPSDADQWGIGSTDITWKGLRLSLYESGPGAENHGQSVFQLLAEAPSVNGIPIEGPDSVAVGDTETDVARFVDTTEDPKFTYGIKGELPLAHWKRPGANPDGGPYLTDWIVAGTEGGKVSYLRATEFDYGA